MLTKRGNEYQSRSIEHRLKRPAPVRAVKRLASQAATHEAAEKRTAELEQERETLRAESRQLIQELEKARAAPGKARHKPPSRPKSE